MLRQRSCLAMSSLPGKKSVRNCNLTKLRKKLRESERKTARLNQIWIILNHIFSNILNGSKARPDASAVTAGPAIDLAEDWPSKLASNKSWKIGVLELLRSISMTWAKEPLFWSPWTHLAAWNLWLCWLLLKSCYPWQEQAEQSEKWRHRMRQTRRE